MQDFPAVTTEAKPPWSSMKVRKPSVLAVRPAIAPLVSTKHLDRQASRAPSFRDFSSNELVRRGLKSRNGDVQSEVAQAILQKVQPARQLTKGSPGQRGGMKGWSPQDHSNDGGMVEAELMPRTKKPVGEGGLVTLIIAAYGAELLICQRK